MKGRFRQPMVVYQDFRPRPRKPEQAREVQSDSAARNQVTPPPQAACRLAGHLRDEAMTGFAAEPYASLPAYQTADVPCRDVICPIEIWRVPFNAHWPKNRTSRQP